MHRPAAWPRTLVVWTLLALPAIDAATIEGGGLIVTVEPAGSYIVSAPGPGWKFQGNIQFPLTSLAIGSGADAAGVYNEISFSFHSDATRHAAIRSYRDHPAVLFTVTDPAATPNTFPFPNWTQYPKNLDHLTFSGIFAPPDFTKFSNDSPWIFFNSAGATFIVSPASNFMSASTNWGPNGEMASGIAAAITSLPAGFQHRTLLVVETGINRAFDTWGQTLTALQGKIRPPNDADAMLDKIGYWTDRGAAYYYQTASGLSYEQTLTAIRANFDRLEIGLGYIQLDSWFYPKGPQAVWTDNGHGIYQYAAASPPFSGSLANFQKVVGVPLVTHARWIDPSSPYRQLYKMSGNVVVEPRYWNTVADYLANSGVATYEQDWLANRAITEFNLTDAGAFLDNMAAAMAQRNLTMQYCMASPRHFLQSSKYSNLTTIRASEDRLAPDRWTSLLYTSRLASAVGAWPFADNFLSPETQNLLVATLTAGPVGIADPAGEIDGNNLLHAVRRDGVIVKPDVPLTPIDSSYQAMAHGEDTPQIAAAYTAFGPLRAAYVFAYRAGANAQAALSPADFGSNSAVYLYDYFARRGQVVHASATVKVPVVNDSLYLIAAPLGPSGIAVLGDLDQFVSLGRKRILALADNGTVSITIAFAKGETSRVITVHSRGRLTVNAVSGSIQAISVDASTHLWRIPVMPDAGGTASLQIRNNHPLAKRSSLR